MWKNDDKCFSLGTKLDTFASNARVRALLMQATAARRRRRRCPLSQPRPSPPNLLALGPVKPRNKSQLSFYKDVNFKRTFKIEPPRGKYGLSVSGNSLKGVANAKCRLRMEGGGSFYILPGEGGGEESKGEREGRFAAAG